MNTNQDMTERLREFLSYDPEAGVFLWKAVPSQRVKVGSVAGSRNGNGYWKIGLDGRKHYAHRLAWLFVHGEWPADEIDHVNGIRDDNRLTNLRQATHAENCQNLSMNGKNRSGHPGVSWCARDRKWRADIKIHGRTRYIGYYDSIEDAIAARKAAKAEVHSFSPRDRLPQAQAAMVAGS